MKTHRTALLTPPAGNLTVPVRLKDQPPRSALTVMKMRTQVTRAVMKMETMRTVMKMKMTRMVMGMMTTIRCVDSSLCSQWIYFHQNKCLNSGP